MDSREVALTQGKLFDYLDSPLHGKVRGEQSIMDFPLFSLAKRPQMEAMTYEMDGVKIEIKPSSSGIATMWDKEVLIYVLSLMVQHIGRTGVKYRTSSPSTHTTSSGRPASDAHRSVITIASSKRSVVCRARRSARTSKLAPWERRASSLGSRKRRRPLAKRRAASINSCRSASSSVTGLSARSRVTAVSTITTTITSVSARLSDAFMNWRTAIVVMKNMKCLWKCWVRRSAQRRRSAL